MSANEHSSETLKPMLTLAGRSDDLAPESLAVWAKLLLQLGQSIDSQRQQELVRDEALEHVQPDSHALPTGAES